MKSELLADFYQDLKKEGIYLSYQGPLWQELLEELNGLVKSKIKIRVKPENITRYLTLFVELVQNIVRYSSSKTGGIDGTEISHGIVIIGSQDNTNYILAGNTVDSYHKKILTKSLEKLKTLDKESLGKMFKGQLRGDIHERGKGAGLGLIDIFRKADEVDYHFSKIGDEGDFFSIKVQFRD